MSWRYFYTVSLTIYSMRRYPAVGVLWMTGALIGLVPRGHSS